MSHDLTALVVLAASIGLFHTLMGPDHYVPFVAMSKARGWSPAQTALLTLVCGIGHVASSVVLGLLGVALGLAVEGLKGVESARGDLAAWMLMAFGLAYFVWGLRRAWTDRPHEHVHVHGPGPVHAHEHTHMGEHAHVHEHEGRANITPWILFTIFVLGPCEPLIPLLMYPAAKNSLFGLILVTVVFGVVTISTMVGVVLVLLMGFNLIPLARLQRYTHALAGAAIGLCGAAIVFLGL